MRLIMFAALTSTLAALAPALAAKDNQREATVAQGLAAITDPELAKADYVEHCAGCHGVQGLSAPAKLPELRGRVGYMMCTPATRAYLLRLPNIAKSRLTDNQQLADMLNFMVFGIGGQSVLPGTKPFTAREVGFERQYALTSASLVAERKRHVETSIRECGAPATFRDFYQSK
ncbi:cytochrome C [Novosphingobium sp.]|uniref:cytochrome C n=1 Tax=Novosphingobium sp. TaxID=1874826 RepID=UPI00356A3818